MQSGLCLVFMTANTHQSVQHLGTTESAKAFSPYGIGAHQHVEAREEIVGSKLLSRELEVCAGGPALHGVLASREISGASGKPAYTIHSKPHRALRAHEAAGGGFD